MKFKIGDRFFLNDPRNVKHGKQGTIVNTQQRGNPYEIMMDGDELAIFGKTPFTWWAREDQLSENPVPRPDPEPLKSTPAIQFESMDISSGFGIGGVGSDDYSMATESGGTSYNSSGCKWSHGTRYDENCESCGRYSFEICNDCGFCERCHGE